LKRALMNIISAAFWVDYLAGIAVPVAILLWVLKHKKEPGSERGHYLVLWGVIAILVANGFMFIGGMFWRWWIMPRIYEIAQFVTLVIWPVLIPFLIRIWWKTNDRWWLLTSPIAFPIVVGHAYWTLNYLLLVNVLGCGCNLTGFNANNFTDLFSLVLVPINWVILFRASINLTHVGRVAYILLGCLSVAFLSWARLLANMWL